MRRLHMQHFPVRPRRVRAPGRLSIRLAVFGCAPPAGAIGVAAARAPRLPGISTTAGRTFYLHGHVRA